MQAATRVLGYEHLSRLMAMMAGDEKHSTAATSTLDVLWVLYDKVLRVSPTTVKDPDRDRFLLSKGHGPMAYYAVLAAKGFIDPAGLSNFGRSGSALGHHPDATLVPGVEIGSGSLGHGLGIAVGMALGLELRRSRADVYCLLGDAEIEEGSNWEAIQLAGRMGLGSLRAIVIDNQSSSFGWPGGIAARFELEGWSAITIDGRSHAAILAAFESAGRARPHALIATVEHKG